VQGQHIEQIEVHPREATRYYWSHWVSWWSLCKHVLDVLINGRGELVVMVQACAACTQHERGELVVMVQACAGCAHKMEGLLGA